MIKVGKKHIKMVFWFFLWVFTLSAAHFNIIQLDCYKKVVNIELSYSLDFKGAKTISEKADSDGKKLSFVLWREDDGIINEKELERSKEVRIISIYGRADLLFFDSYLFDETDQEGCLIDKETAYKLFGDTAVIGRSIIYHGKEYVIRDILDSVKGVFVIQADKNSFFNMVTVSNDSEIDPTFIASQLSNDYYLTGTVIELNILIYFSHVLVSALPYIIGCIWIMKALWNYKKIYNDSMLRYILFSLAFWFVLFLAILILFKYSSFPDYFIPPKWSDYYFWKDTKKEVLVILENLFEIERRKSIKPFYISFYKNVIYSILSLGIIFKIKGLLKNIKKGNERD